MGLFILIMVSLQISAQESQHKSLMHLQKISPVNALNGDRFATSVSISGNQMVVGAPGGNSDAGDKMFGTGMAYVYEFINSTWQKTAELIADDAQARDRFGYSVSIDGDRIIVGNYRRNKFYIFEKVASVWTQTFSLQYNISAYGFSVQLVGDFAYVSAPKLEINNTKNAGSVLIYERVALNNWVQRAQITMNPVVENAYFGGKIEFNNNLLYIGASGRNKINGNLFVYENQGGTWTKIDTIQANDVTINDRFATNFAIQGNKMLVSSYKATLANPNVPSAGAVYVFEKQNTSWIQTQKLTASDAQDSDYFGKALSFYGNQIAIGAPYDDDNGINTGSVYVYAQSAGTWKLLLKQQANNPQAGDAFGNLIINSGGSLYIGAQGDNALYQY